MPLWQPPGRNGWPDTVAGWASPEGMKSRLYVSAAIASRVKNLINPSELSGTIAGDAASAETRQAVARAESRQQGLHCCSCHPNSSGGSDELAVRTASPSRRSVLASSGALFAWAFLPNLHERPRCSSIRA